VLAFSLVRSSFPKYLPLLALLAGCAQLPGLTLGPGQTLKGKVSGATFSGATTKVGVLSGSFLPSDMTRAAVVSVSGDGSWSYSLPAGAKENLTVFAFQDTNGNGKFDSGEKNSYTGCPGCSYVVASPVGDAWKVYIKRSGTSSDTDVASANIDFSA